MSQVIIATTEDELRTDMSTALLEAGFAVGFATCWPQIVEGIVRKSNVLMVLDASLPDLKNNTDRASLLTRLAASMPHQPMLLSIRGRLQGMEQAPPQPGILRRYAAALAGPAIPPEERRLLSLLGLGQNPLRALANISRSEQPLCIEGEQGCGKKTVARSLHRLTGASAFLRARWSQKRGWQESVEGNAEEPSSGRLPRQLGTLYLTLDGPWSDEGVITGIERASSLGFRLVLGSRGPCPRHPGWIQLVLSPLRQRPQDLRALAQHYLDIHHYRLGIPKRRFGRGLWALIEAYHWPGNARELETFVSTVLSQVDRPMIHLRDLPSETQRMLDERHDPSPEDPLQNVRDLSLRLAEETFSAHAASGRHPNHDEYIDLIERPFLELALKRTCGNQKSAAEMIGMNRNTLRAHLLRLGLDQRG